MKNREGGFYSRKVGGRPETPKERRERLLPGIGDLESLAHGITEDDEFNEDGEFNEGDDKDALVDALVSDYFNGGTRNGKVVNIKSSSHSGSNKHADGNYTYRYYDRQVDEVKLLTYEDIIEIIKECIDDRCI